MMNNFTKAANTYESAATFQRHLADKIIHRLKKLSLWPDTVLEIGCGTGLLTQQLNTLYPAAQITAIDNNSAMLNQLKRKNLPVDIIQADAATLPVKTTSIDLIVSSLMLNWLRHQTSAIQHWQRLLSPNGIGVVYATSQRSFPEWGHADARTYLCDAEDFSALPNVLVSHEKYAIEYENKWSFLQHFKYTGTNKTAAGYQPLRIAELRAIQQDTTPFTTTWEVLCLILHPF